MRKFELKIVIWGTGHYCIQIEEYIREEIEILAFVENRRVFWGGGIRLLWTQNKDY